MRLYIVYIPNTLLFLTIEADDYTRNQFIENDEHFVDPKIPVRQPQNIYYPGRDNSLAQAIREGLLERKSKYLKRYD